MPRYLGPWMPYQCAGCEWRAKLICLDRYRKMSLPFPNGKRGKGVFHPLLFVRFFCCFVLPPIKAPPCPLFFFFFFFFFFSFPFFFFFFFFFFSLLFFFLFFSLPLFFPFLFLPSPSSFCFHQLL